jgi:hypothetical protein
MNSSPVFYNFFHMAQWEIGWTKVQNFSRFWFRTFYLIDNTQLRKNQNIKSLATCYFSNKDLESENLGESFFFGCARFSWSDLMSKKIVNKQKRRMRDGPRCPKQVSLKSDLLLPLTLLITKFLKVYFFQRLSISRLFLMNISLSNLIYVFQSS